MSTFQIILLSIFGAFIIIAVVLFATVKSSNNNELPPVVLWGTVSQSDFNQVISQDADQKPNVTYVQKRPETFDHDLVEAIASGVGPDIILLPQDLIARYQDKVYPLPYSSYPLRQFKNTFVQESDLLTSKDGILAFPFTIDPLVMYWNRDLLATAGIATPPKTWADVLNLPKLLTKKDNAGNITQSAVALGEYSNVTDAKEILSGMFLQAGTEVTTHDADSGKLQSGLMMSSGVNSTSGADDSPAVSVLRFYTGFSDPVKTTYSWNQSLQNSNDAFASGDLAIYFGFASEYDGIYHKNPNLNFDVARFPQIQDAQVNTTFGRMNSFAVLKTSKNITGSFQNITALTGKGVVSAWAKQTKTVPAVLSLIVSDPTDPNQDVFSSSALISRAWLDPDPSQTDQVFKSMVNDVTSGALRLSESINSASQKIDQIIYSM